MKKLLLHPLFASVFVLLYVGIFALYCFGETAAFIKGFTGGVMEIITYTGYTLSAVVVLAFAKDFNTKKLLPSYVAFLFLLGCAVLREMGVQHWIPSKDTTAFKIRFFTNPNNPIEEKILSAVILLTVISVVVWLLVKYTPTLIKGFLKFNPICWTIAAMGGVGIVTKFADRFPGNYRKAVGESLDPLAQSWIVLFEESGEATLPLLFAIAVIQWHFVKKKG
ncbi:MAG: hypothetical protein IKV03_06465 [Alphaproteobacteria bacterium]|nr:hypothetical protein [Alphaproteobacteria bacterium]